MQMFCRVILILLIATSSLFSQAKVGTTGAQFLEISPSVRSNGMGETGVALVDRQSFFFNPGALGLTGNQLSPASVYFGFSDQPAGVEYYSTGIVMRLRGDADHRSLILALQRTALESGTMIERTYEQGTFEGTGREFTASDQVYSVTMATGSGSKIKVGLGATAKWIEERFHNYSTTGFSFDAGGIVRVPLTGESDSPSDSGANSKLHLTFGASLTNYGMDMKFIDKAYPLPKTVRVGAAVEAARGILTGVIAVESQSILNAEGSDKKIGLEIGIRDALWARVGRTSTKWRADSQSTIGGSLSVRGVIDWVARRPLNRADNVGFLHRVDLMSSYALSHGEVDWVMLEFVM